MREREDRYGFDIQADFGSIYYHMQAVVEDDGAIEGPDTDTDWKQDHGERSRCEYEWWSTVLN